MVAFLWHIFRIKNLFQNATNDLINIFKGRASSSSSIFPSPPPLNSLLFSRKRSYIQETLPSQRLHSCHAWQDITVHWLSLFHWKHTLKHFSQSEPVVWKRGDFYWPLLLLILSKLFRGQHKDGTFSKPLAQRMGENVCWVVWRESPPECPQLRVSGSSLEDVPLKC